MALKLYDSPFHVTHDNEVASKMAMKMDLSIMLSNLIKEQDWTQVEAAAKLNTKQSRMSDLKNAKIENLPLMPCSICSMY
ncbi:helix-turn-helix domain-containing protein [Marinomonas polaris]|uniref:helix-turn-helix domain-containing protein n=1 Tax=Marinomonas polaris TaxID=293552 RepID=UPI003F9A062A